MCQPKALDRPAASTNRPACLPSRAANRRRRAAHRIRVCVMIAALVRVASVAIEMPALRPSKTPLLGRSSCVGLACGRPPGVSECMWLGVIGQRVFDMMFVRRGAVRRSRRSSSNKTGLNPPAANRAIVVRAAALGPQTPQRGHRAVQTESAALSEGDPRRAYNRGGDDGASTACGRQRKPSSFRKKACRQGLPSRVSKRVGTGTVPKTSDPAHSILFVWLFFCRSTPIV